MRAIWHFFAAGGHACLRDYPDAKGLQDIAAKIYDAGGIVSAVCHGPAILPGIIDPKTGKSINCGQEGDRLHNQGEEEKGVLEAIKSWNRPTIEEAAAGAGATCEASYFSARRTSLPIIASQMFRLLLAGFSFLHLRHPVTSPIPAKMLDAFKIGAFTAAAYAKELRSCRSKAVFWVREDVKNSTLDIDGQWISEVNRTNNWFSASRDDIPTMTRDVLNVGRRWVDKRTSNDARSLPVRTPHREA
jgi:hypothetical protein